MSSDSETSSFPASKSHVMISLCTVTSQLTWVISEKDDAHKFISILKKKRREW